jgi:heterodisulfide reductase subunit A-like polyferredoxin
LDTEEEIRSTNDISQNDINGEKYDVVIRGTTFNSLNKAIDLGGAGMKVCLIAQNTSYEPEPALLTKNFSDFPTYNRDYCKMVDKVFHHDNISILRNTTIDHINLY